MNKIRLITAVWCTSCLIMRPRFLAFLSKNPQWEIEELDYDTDAHVISSLHIGKTLPVAIIEIENQEKTRIIGEKSIRDIEKILGEFL